MVKNRVIDSYHWLVPLKLVFIMCFENRIHLAVCNWAKSSKVNLSLTILLIEEHSYCFFKRCLQLY